MVRTEAVARPRTLACTLLSVSLAAAATEATVSAAGAASVAAAAPWAQGGFTESAMANVSAVREQIKALPFLQELVAGTLPEASFAFYLTQDSLYLRQYSKVLAALASRAPTVAVTQNMARAADMALVVEGALHEGFLSSLSELSAEERRRTEPSPTCAAYTDYQQSRLAFSPYEVAFAAALPCYTIYAEVGRHILSITQGAELDANPYKAWVQTYGGQDFEEATARAVAALDELAEGTTMAVREEMLRAFRQSTSYYPYHIFRIRSLVLTILLQAVCSLRVDVLGQCVSAGAVADLRVRCRWSVREHMAFKRGARGVYVVHVCKRRGLQ
jgi:thiaminase/transcriptional activator TenA